MSEVTPKRFIAGAVCPKCGEMDKIMMYQRDGVDQRECVRCGYHDEMRFEQNPQELSTRVNAPVVAQQEASEKEAGVDVLVFKPQPDGE